MSRSKEGFLWTPTQSIKGLPTDAVERSSSAVQEEYDVIVIGAGFAGLIVARDLSLMYQLNVLLLEARDRIGGRTWTATVLGEDVEMGGTWVHWDQPHVYSQLQRYGLHRNLKPSAGMLAPKKQFFKYASHPIEEVSIQDAATMLERVAKRFFAIDGLDSRLLMPYPHDPLREPAPWRQYDNLSVKDRLDQLSDIPDRERALFGSNISTFGSAPGKDMGFVDALRWYVLGGHSMAGVFEKAGFYKLGNGGMTAFARAILNDYRGDILFNSPVAGIAQVEEVVTINTLQGRTLRAKAAISTIPL